MALIKCHECGQGVSTEAKACPSCGAGVKKVKPPKPKTSRAFLWIVGIAGLGIIAALGVGEPRQGSSNSAQMTPEQKAEHDKRATLQVLSKRCADVIQSSLKFPEGAEIPNANSASDSDKFYTEEKNGIYLVQVKYRARNGFNVLRNSTVECKWKLVGDNYKSLGIKSLD